MKLCTWTYDEEYHSWNTTCEKAFVIEDGTPNTTEMLFCCFCGRRIKEKVPAPPSQEDDDE